MKANAKLAPASASFAIGQEEHVSFNRRYLMKDGTVGWNPGKLNPKVDRPAGPIDPDVPVVYFESADGKATPIATHVSFAMHLDTVGGERDLRRLPGAALRDARQVQGPRHGDGLRHRRVRRHQPHQPQHPRKQEGPGEAPRIGTLLAGEVIKTYARLEAASPTARSA